MPIFFMFLGLVLCFFSNGFTAPPQTIPPSLRNEYTLNGRIPVYPWYFDDTYTEPKIYPNQQYVAYIQKALRRENFYYGLTDAYLYQALDEMADFLVGREVAVIGSAGPWYESILLSYGAHPFVIEYNPITSEYPNVTYLTPAQFKANPRTFDLVLSISSTEHDGLGRYGDPLNPNGDLKSMDDFKNMLNPNGKLILAVPVGPDALFWNAHRRYGHIRLKMLLKGWKSLKYYGYDSRNLNAPMEYQPVFLLQPK